MKRNQCWLRQSSRKVQLKLVKVDIVLHCPEMQGLSGELGTIVHGDGSRQSTKTGKRLEDLDEGGPPMEVSTWIARHWRGKSSTMLRHGSK